MTTRMEQISPGIIKLINDIDEYIFWTHAKVVRPYIAKFLIQQFPNGYVEHEINDIDIVITGENLPVEIQSTPTSDFGVGPSAFEKAIQKQIKENIDNHGRCWFFFDSEFLRHLQNPDIHRKTNINLDWFRKYMKEDVLKVFTIGYNGIITETNYKDFDFVSNLSMTCRVGYEDDMKVLNRNKLKILDGMLRGYRFNQREISKFREEWARSGVKDFKKFLYKHENVMARLYARILHCVAGYLEAVNDILDLHVENVDMKHEKYYISVLGLFDMEKSSQSSFATFLDKFDIAKYFPGYMGNRDTWDNLRGKRIQGRKLDHILKRTYKITEGVDYFWNKYDNINI